MDSNGKSKAINKFVQKQSTPNQPTTRLTFRRPSREEIITTMRLYPELSYEELDALFYLFGVGGPDGMVFDADDKGTTTYEYSSLLPGFHYDGRHTSRHRLSKL
ncbi:hypothetical protein KEM56_006718 [Ascosphaera pollenicola]|nr:hypothetical protein KEM56_006718 [Ascosphaera pollenicola]